jgi:sugar/nucleoside kinase (ribokinase family)
MAKTARLVDARERASFEVICAGEPLWRTVSVRSDGLAPLAPRASILDVARTLARTEFRVGLATVLDDDRFGRALRAEMAALGIDVGGVAFAAPAAGLVVVDAAGGQLGVVSERNAARDFEIPPAWSSQVLLLSGLSPVTSKAAALCKAARKARRDGTIVVLDVAGSLRQWAGRDPRMISMVIREVDVVRCSLMDLAVLGTDSASVRRAMRSDATLVVSDEAGTTAAGPFGEVRVKGSSGASEDSGEPCTAAICAELARPHRGTESHDGRWHRILRESVRRTPSAMIAR